MFFERSKNGWVVHAPAKINLALEVLGRRTDGYHQVETLLVPVRLFDTLTYSPSSDPLQLSVDITPQCRTTSGTDLEHSNLAVQAIRRLAQVSGQNATGQLKLTKRIPIQAGLGGGSSDAAAALVVANAAWNLGYSTQQLASVARGLGTDVPFFLFGGAGLGAGRGEQIASVSIPAGVPIVLVQPPVGLSTPQVFQALGLALGEMRAAGVSRCRQLAMHLASGGSIAACKQLVHNCLQRAAVGLNSWVGRIADAMDKLPVLAHQMTGSGSGYFAVCRTWREACSIASQLRAGPWQFVAATQTCR